MRTIPVEELVATGMQALGNGDFDTAKASFEAASDPDPNPAANDGLAYLAYITDDHETARRLWELTYRAYKDAGDLKSAAMVATNLASVYYDWLGNESAAQGWLGRAERLLEREGRCVERGYLALALVACNIRNANTLEQSAAVALELALEYGDSSLEARALADGGLALINQGKMAKGFAQLDEAMAAVSAGEVMPLFSGKIFCALLTACERTGDVRRAEEWTQACTVMSESWSAEVPILRSHCRTAYGVVLCDTGKWGAAETEIMHSLAPTAGTSIVKRADAAGALAALRLLQGRVEEAAEVLAPYADRFEVCEPMARLHFMRGEHDLAFALIVRSLQDLVGDRLRAARLLSLLVEVELTRGNNPGAEHALDRLIESAEASDSVVLRSAAKLAEGRIAKHNAVWPSAIAALQDAAKILGDEDRPILAGRIRLELADALAQTGDSATATAEARSALAIFERLGADRDADQVSALLRTLGVTGRAGTRERDASVGSLTARERDVFTLLAEGLTNAEIAQRLFITPKTAEHHVSRVLAKLGVRSRTEAAAIAATQ